MLHTFLKYELTNKHANYSHFCLAGINCSNWQKPKQASAGWDGHKLVVDTLSVIGQSSRIYLWDKVETWSVGPSVGWSIGPSVWGVCEKVSFTRDQKYHLTLDICNSDISDFRDYSDSSDSSASSDSSERSDSSDSCF